jgi:hypothetical protein
LVVQFKTREESNIRVNKAVSALVAGGAVVVMSSVSGLAAQTLQEHQHAAADKAKPPSGMEAKCQAMMAERDKMMTGMKAADQRLDELVARMNTASGMEKMTATAAVVTEMVTQRRTMREGMMKMQEGMMSHMMEHMQAGAASMAMCPMMKQMGGMKS